MGYDTSSDNFVVCVLRFSRTFLTKMHTFKTYALKKTPKIDDHFKRPKLSSDFLLLV